MNNTESSTTTQKTAVNGMSESGLKQTKISFTEVSKKRKLQNEDANGTTELAYIDLTNQKNNNADAENNPLNENLRSIPNKVCIIQKIEAKNKTKTNDMSSPRNASLSSSSSPLQKWFKHVKTDTNTTITVGASAKDVAIRRNSSSEEESSVVPGKEVDEQMEVDVPDIVQTTTDTPQDDENEDSEKLVDTSSVTSLDGSMVESESGHNTSETGAFKTPSPRKMLKKTLTPKQLQKRKEMEERKLEKQRLKEEKDKKRQDEKDAKIRLKEEKERKRLAEIEAKSEEKRLKEEERKTKEEEKRTKEEEKKRAKEEERKQKEEERKQKEEERRQKEEEKKQKEEQKRIKEEQERKAKEKSAAAFTNFFLPKSKTSQPKSNPENMDKTSTVRFMPFEVKERMKLAAVQRRTIGEQELNVLDEFLRTQRGEANKNELYLSSLKSKDYKRRTSKNTWPIQANDDEDDDVVLVDDTLTSVDTVSDSEKRTRYRCKLLQFKENRRPAYWGTWRKTSKIVTGRTPFKQDKLFDYEIDSDEEWDDEPGESLHGSDDEEKESEDDYEVDNEVFVPHGYLSDEEGQNDDVADSSSPTANEMKLNILEKEFEAEMKEKTHKLKPRIFGCIWISNDTLKDKGANAVENLLLSCRAVWNESRTPFVIRGTDDDASTPQTTPSVKSKFRNEFPEAYMTDFIRLVHGNKRNNKFIAREFNAYIWSKDVTMNLTLGCIMKTLKKISNWISNLGCRIVHDEVRGQHGLQDLSHLENGWKYITVCEEPEPNAAAENGGNMANSSSASQPPPAAAAAAAALSASATNAAKPKPVNVPSITKFVKVLTPEERERQMALLNETAVAAAAAEKKTPCVASSPSTHNNLAVEPKKINSITKFLKVLTSDEKKMSSSSSSGNELSAKKVLKLEAPPSVTGNPPGVATSVLPKPLSARTETETSVVVPSSATANSDTLSAEKRPSLAEAKKPSTPKRIKPILLGGVTKKPTMATNETESRPPNNVEKEGDSVEKPDNVFVPLKREKSVNCGDAIASSVANVVAKPVNILIPRRASKNTAATEYSTVSKFSSVNTLIPRKAIPTSNNESSK